MTRNKVIEAAIHDCGNRSIREVPQALWDHYFPLCPPHLDHEHSGDQGTGNEALGFGAIVAGENMDKTIMVVHWTPRCERDIDVPEVRFVGRLTSESLGVLMAKILNEPQRSRVIVSLVCGGHE